MPASGPRSRGARAHPRSCQGCQPWLPTSATSGLVLATQKLGGVTGRGTHVRPDRRRRQDRREPRPESAARRPRPRGDADRAATRPLRTARARVRAPGAAGGGTETHVLDRAGIARPPDVVVAVTGDDEDNLIICQLAREKYGVGKVVARVND